MCKAGVYDPFGLFFFDVVFSLLSLFDACKTEGGFFNGNRRGRLVASKKKSPVSCKL